MTQLQKNDVATNEKPMTVEAPNLRLQDVRARLKCGEYDGTDIMAAWIAIDELLAVQAELAEQRGSGEPVAWGQLGTLNGRLFLRSNYDRSPYPPPPSIVRALNLVPLYAVPQSREPLTDEQIARLFHDAYKRLAPTFLYCDSRTLDPESPNDKLMIAVLREVAHNIRSAG